MALDPAYEATDVKFKDILHLEKLKSFQNHLGLEDGKRFIRWDRFLRGAGNLPTCFPIILIAAQFNYVDVVKSEIQRRVDIETKSHCGGTALLWAARGGSVQAVQYLLTKKAKIDDQSHVRQATALTETLFLENHTAVFPGNYNIVQILLEAGANPDLKDIDDWTPLKVIINSNNKYGDEVSVVKILLEHSPRLWKANYKAADSVLRHLAYAKPTRIFGIDFFFFYYLRLHPNYE